MANFSTLLTNSTTSWVSDPVGQFVIQQRRKSWWPFSKQKKYTVDEFFKVVKRGMSSSTASSAKRLSDSIVQRFEKAKAAGQTKMLERLGKMAEGMRKELSAVEAFGQLRYVSDSAVNDLMSSGVDGRQVFCVPVSEYENEIPETALREISKANQARVYDEIVVLYTRKMSQPKELDGTRKRNDKWARREAGKDPIAFGRIRDTDRLYFIADWTDDECDFTLSKLESSIGENAKKLP